MTARHTTIIGAQWGDEGKGKIVDFLSEDYDVVVRFQGGNNAGHTLVVGDKTYKLHLLPSCLLRQGKRALIATGVVADLAVLLQEIAAMRDHGVELSRDNLLIDTKVAVILPIHKLLDECREKKLQQSGQQTIGTTKRGIGPCYEDRVGRRAIHFYDILPSSSHSPLSVQNIRESLLKKIAYVYNHYEPELNSMGFDLPDVEQTVDQLLAYGEKLALHACSGTDHIRDAEQSGERILFEGAQGAMLDVYYGTYPFVTSSHTVAGYASVGSGFNINNSETLVVAKAYTTRVGEGAFPTELNDEDGEKLGKFGNELGTTTGRKRRCGWLDLVQLKQVCKVNNANGIVLTKLDVLTHFDQIKVCTCYDTDVFDDRYEIYRQIKPKYQLMHSWSLTDLENFNGDELAKFIALVEDFCETKVKIISYGPERNQTKVL